GLAAEPPDDAAVALDALALALDEQHEHVRQRRLDEEPRAGVGEVDDHAVARKRAGDGHILRPAIDRLTHGAAPLGRPGLQARDHGAKRGWRRLMVRHRTGGPVQAWLDRPRAFEATSTHRAR